MRSPDRVDDGSTLPPAEHESGTRTRDPPRDSAAPLEGDWHQVGRDLPGHAEQPPTRLVGERLAPSRALTAWNQPPALSQCDRLPPPNHTPHRKLWCPMTALPPAWVVGVSSEGAPVTDANERLTTFDNSIVSCGCGESSPIGLPSRPPGCNSRHPLLTLSAATRGRGVAAARDSPKVSARVRIPSSASRHTPRPGQPYSSGQTAKPPA